MKLLFPYTGFTQAQFLLSNRELVKAFESPILFLWMEEKAGDLSTI
jgi:hypothetical protein